LNTTTTTNVQIYDDIDELAWNAVEFQDIPNQFTMDSVEVW